MQQPWRRRQSKSPRGSHGEEREAEGTEIRPGRAVSGVETSRGGVLIPGQRGGGDLVVGKPPPEVSAPSSVLSGLGPAWPSVRRGKDCRGSRGSRETMRGGTCDSHTTPTTMGDGGPTRAKRVEGAGRPTPSPQAQQLGKEPAEFKAFQRGEEDLDSFSFSFSSWCFCITRWVLRTKTPFSAYLSSTFRLCRDGPLAPPLPLCFHCLCLHLRSMRRWPRVSLERGEPRMD